MGFMGKLLERRLRIGGQEAKPGKFINSGVLEYMLLRICDTAAWNHLLVHLDTPTG